MRNIFEETMINFAAPQILKDILIGPAAQQAITTAATQIINVCKQENINLNYLYYFPCQESQRLAKHFVEAYIDKTSLASWKAEYDALYNKYVHLLKHANQLKEHLEAMPVPEVSKTLWLSMTQGRWEAVPNQLKDFIDLITPTPRWDEQVCIYYYDKHKYSFQEVVSAVRCDRRNGFRCHPVYVFSDIEVHSAKHGVLRGYTESCGYGLVPGLERNPVLPVAEVMDLSHDGWDVQYICVDNEYTVVNLQEAMQEYQSLITEGDSNMDPEELALMIIDAAQVADWEYKEVQWDAVHKIFSLSEFAKLLQTYTSVWGLYMPHQETELRCRLIVHYCGNTKSLLFETDQQYVHYWTCGS